MIPQVKPHISSSSLSTLKSKNCKLLPLLDNVNYTVQLSLKHYIITIKETVFFGNKVGLY